jgi:hypothetical protein
MYKYLLTLFLLLLSPLVNAAPLEFENARIPEAPPGARAMAAYMKVINSDKQTRSITEISSNEFGKVEMHQSIVENGVARMQAMETLQIPAQGSIELAPGGMHLMLLEPKKHYMAGELIVLYLTESDGTEHSLVITVKKMAAATQHHHE